PEDDYASDDEINIGFPYRNTSRTRINGLGNNGISFINTGRGRDLGAAVLALNTVSLNHMEFDWKASTLIPNSRNYAIRLQYRAGIDSYWKDLKDENGNIIEYMRNENAGHSHEFQNISLPGDALNKPYVQLRWLYYYTGLQSDPDVNARDMLALNNVKIGDIIINTDEIEYTFGNILFAYPNPVSGYKVYFNKVTSGHLYDITGRVMAIIENEDAISTQGLSNGVYIFRSIYGESVRFIVGKP
ncbi:MAG: T9SS type A sorting domain-containing protein, partial [Bacteroidales bacterium]|nr:T9SS type A sorting domain-containing protein [Bacteroidales bacterium]